MILMVVSIAGAAPFAYITNNASNNVSVIDTATNTVTATVNVGTTPYGVAVSPNGQNVYVANTDDFYNGTVSVIDTATNKVTATVKIGITPIGIAVSPNGQYVYVTFNGDFPGAVDVINTTTNTVIGAIGVGQFPVGVAVNPDGSNVYVVIGHSNIVSVINMTTNNVTAEVSVGEHPYGVAVNPDGTKAYVTNWHDATVSVIDTSTNTVSATVSGLNYPGGVAVSPDGTKAYVTNEGNNTVSVINTTNNTAYASVNVGNNPFGIAVTPDGRNVYVANQNDNNVSVIDTKTNTVAATVPVGISPAAFGQFIGPMLITPTITWNNPANITYGTALVAGQLNAQSSASGTFAYTEGSTPVDTTTVLSAGTHTLTATFTSTDPNYVSGGTVTATIIVKKATPILTWAPNPLADISHGTQLNGELDATATDPTTGKTVDGTFVYTDEAGNVVTENSVLSVGTHTLTATFTPTDTTNYTGGVTSIMVVIQKENENSDRIKWRNIHPLR
jgi:YVTN family beta-propeller protein